MAENKLPAIFQLFIDFGTELATRFVEDRRVALISFTGSTEVGRKVGERVAARLGKSLLELGGNNAVIVDETANLDLAVPAIVFGAVGTAGQRCTSTRRVFAHKGDRRGAGEAAGARLPAGAHRRPAGERHAHGSADRQRGGRSATTTRWSRPAQPAASCSPAARPPSRAATSSSRRSCAPATSGRSCRPRPSRRSCTSSRWTRSTRRSPSRMPPRTACPRRSSPTGCRTRRASCPPPAATAASPTSTSAPPGRRSAAPSAGRRTPAAGANPARTPGRPTCAARPTR